MTMILGFIIIYLSIVLGSIFWSSILNKKIETTIAINIGIIVLALYLFSAINLLAQGVYIIATANIILGIITIIVKRKKVLEKVLTPGFVFFSLMYFILMITNFNKQLIHFDQYLYRSINTKMVFYNNNILEEYVRIYPPMTTLLEYYFLKLTGIYIQGIEAFAMQMYGIALLLPIYENIKKSKLANIVVGLTILFLPAVFTNLVFYQSSYPDATLGLLIGYMLYTFFADSNIKYKIVALSIATGMMVLTKPSGIAIVLIIVAMLGIYEILKNKYSKKENIKKIFTNKNIKIILTILLIAVLVFISWKLVLKLYKVGTDRVDQSRVGDSSVQYVGNSLMTTIFGKYEDNNDAAESNANFIPKIYSVKGFTTPVQTSLAITSIIIIAGYVYYYYKSNNKDLKYQIIAIIIGLILYMIFLQLSYLLKFVTFEMLGHNGIDRYFPTFLLGMLYLLIASIIKKLSQKEYIARDYIIILLIMFLITPIQYVCEATITSGMYNINSMEYVNNAKNIADKIDEYVEDDSKIITISQKEKTRLYNLMLRYYLYPNHNVKTIENIKEENIEKVQEVIKSNEYQYIYIYSTDSELTNMLEKDFDNLEDVKEKTLYKIQYNDENDMTLIEQAYIDEKIDE